MAARYAYLVNKWTVTAAVTLAVLAAVLAAALPAWAQQSDPIEYAENGTGPVATFTAVDPEGATPITWTLAPSGADPDGVDGPLTDTDAADVLHFDIDKDGVLTFDIGGDVSSDTSPDDSMPPDYEAPRGAAVPADTAAAAANTYKVVVVACDAELAGDPPACPDTAKAAYHGVTVKVTNIDETGTVKWTVDHDYDGSTHSADSPKLVQFQVGANLMATVEDGDRPGAGATNKTVPAADIRWQWYRSPSMTAMGTAIQDDANAASYTVTTNDIGMYLRAEAFYNVGTGREEPASLTSDYPVLAERSNNKAPEFSPTAVTREVNEGKKGMNVGAPVTATDDITNKLTYAIATVSDEATSLDAARFKIDAKTGQITTNVDLDREGVNPADANTLGSCSGADGTDADPECTVVVTATDSAGTPAGTPATVTIKITNVDEKPKFTSGFKMRDVAEGTTQVDNNDDATDALEGDAIYTASDPEGRTITYHLMGPDRSKFQFSADRDLSFRAKPDYEMPTDANKDNVYEVTVRASDGTMHADRMVMVTVMGVDDAPEIMGQDTFTHPENDKSQVASFTAEDPEGATPITWTLAPSGADPDGVDGPLTDTDAADVLHFDIDKDGVLTFDIGGDVSSDTSPDDSMPPDYEAPRGAAVPADTTAAAANTYKVVVVACDAELAGDPPACPDTAKAAYHGVTVKVTNIDETGTVKWTVDHDYDGSTHSADSPKLVQFQVGANLMATVEDGDIGGTVKTVTDADHNLTWRWYRGAPASQPRPTPTTP